MESTDQGAAQSGAVPQQPQQPRSVEERMAAWLDQQDNPAPPPTAKQEPVQQAQPEGDAEPQGAVQEPEEGEATPETEAEAPGEQVEIDEESPLFEIEYRAAGKPVQEKVSLKQLREGYMRTQDYQAKTQELAAARKSQEGEVQKAASAMRDQYVGQLEGFQKAIVSLAASELGNVDWNRLATDDPLEYTRLSHRANQVRGLFQAAQAEVQKAHAEREAAKKQSMQEAIRKANEELPSAIPGWGDETYQSLMKLAVEYGIPPDKVAEETSVGFFKMAHDAAQYRKTQKANPAEKRVVKVPKVVKPGTNDAQSAKDVELKKLQSRLRKSGKVEDAAALWLAKTGGR